MAHPSLLYRIRSLWKRMAHTFNWHVRVPLLLVLKVKNWPDVFSGKPATQDMTYTLRSGETLFVPAGSTNINPYIDVSINHVYEHPRIRWQPKMTIVDIGAHIGAFTLHAARQSPDSTIIACEPDPETCAALRKNVETNTLQSRVRIVDSAVGGTAGTAVLHVLSGRSEANSLYKALDGSKEVRVPLITLADLFSKHITGRCHLLKMNAEGVEYEILYGLPPEILSRIDAMVINYHVFVQKPDANVTVLTAYLQKHGFRVQEQGKRILAAWRE